MMRTARSPDEKKKAVVRQSLTARPHAASMTGSGRGTRWRGMGKGEGERGREGGRECVDALPPGLAGSALPRLTRFRAPGGPGLCFAQTFATPRQLCLDGCKTTPRGRRQVVGQEAEEGLRHWACQPARWHAQEKKCVFAARPLHTG